MILTFDSVGWFFDKFRGFFGSIDYLIYSLISWVVEGIFNLSSLATNPTLAQEIYQRIYVILAIFMVFKLSFSFIKYLVSPDTMTDKEQGVGKLIARTVTMLAILIMLPVLFFSTDLPYMGGETVLTVLQNGVVKTIPKIILGVADTEDSTSKSARENGDYMALMMIGSLYYPSICNPDSDNYIGEEEAVKKCSFTDFGDYNRDGEVNLKDFYSTINNEGDSDEYEFQYMWPLTTIAGVLLIVILGGICIDVAIRVFKLLVLEMMAPIPVMTYIDPKSSKDGAFSKWLGSFISTYVDLFIKLATVYLLLLLISKMFANGKGALFANGGISSIDGVMSRNLVRVFLVIGLFKFAKDAPKFIKDAMGIKDSGGGGLFGGLATLGAAAGTIGGAAAGLVGGAAGGVAAAKAAGNNKFLGAMKGIGSGATGLVRGGAQGAKGAAKGNLFKGISGAVAAQNAVTQKKLAASAAGSTWAGRMGARFDEFRGKTKSFEAAAEDAKNLNAAAGNLKTIRDTAKNKGYINRSLAVGQVNYKDSKGRSNVTRFKAGEHALFKDAFENASREGLTSVNFNGHTYDMTTAGSIYKELNDKVADKYLESYSIGSDATIDAAFEDYRTNLDMVSEDNLGSIEMLTDASAVTDDYSKSVQKKGSTVRNSIDPSAARKYKANKDAIKRNGK